MGRGKLLRLKEFKGNERHFKIPDIKFIIILTLKYKDCCFFLLIFKKNWFSFAQKLG